MLVRYDQHSSSTTVHLTALSQSVSQTLHTATSSILSPLVNTYLQQEDEQEVFITLLRRVITSMIHHVKDAERFSILSALLTQTVSQPENMQSSNEGRACRSLQLITIPCSVRRGSRMTGTCPRLSSLWEPGLTHYTHSCPTSHPPLPLPFRPILGIHPPPPPTIPRLDPDSR